VGDGPSGPLFLVPLVMVADWRHPQGPAYSLEVIFILRAGDRHTVSPA
jgi:hypothetical protein